MFYYEENLMKLSDSSEELLNVFFQARGYFEHTLACLIK